MNFPRMLAVTRKEAFQILRDRRSLYLALGIPLVLLVLFGYALSLDVDNIPMAVWDQERSPKSRELVDRLTSSGYFTMVMYTDSYKSMVDAIDQRDAYIGLVIPWNFTRTLTHKGGATVQAFLDGSDATRAGIAIGYLNVITSIYRNDLLTEELRRQAVQKVDPPIEPRINLLYNPELKSRINIIPGLVAIIMMVIAALLTSLTIVRERETGTMEQLISTPIKPSELVIGKLIPYFVLGYVDMLMVYLAGQWIFGVPFRGSTGLMFALSGLFLVGSLAFGVWISTVAQTQLAATQFALLGTFLPSFLLSGFVFPISNMPLFEQLITYVIPAKYFIVILRGIYLKGVGIEVLALQALALVIFGVITTSLAALKMGKKLR
ncbi:MAG: ABC transporter permease [Thermodesulfobacteriota bacterium]